MLFRCKARQQYYFGQPSPPHVIVIVIVIVVVVVIVIVIVIVVVIVIVIVIVIVWQGVQAAQHGVCQFSNHTAADRVCNVAKKWRIRKMKNKPAKMRKRRLADPQKSTVEGREVTHCHQN